MNIKKWLSVFLAGSVCLTQVQLLPAAAAFSANYAEALQKAIYFYECQQAGPLPDWNRVEWRADSTLEDYVTGGWYDAGDNAKFNLPMAYSAGMLAWGLYQYPDGLEQTGQMETYVNNLTFALDYLATCDKGDTVVYQVGIGKEDHTWWGACELVEYGMKDNGVSERGYLEGRDASAVTGQMAAALAAGSVALKGRIPDATCADYLSHAENLFQMADADRSDAGYNASDAQGFYQSSAFYDDLFYAANWLYIATGESSYLDKATSYIPSLGRELGSDTLKYSWCQCWDDVMQGGMLLYAQNTENPTYIQHVKRHLDYWTNEVQQLDGGFRWLTTWGCLRYAAAAGFIAAVACDTVLADTDTSAYVDFYQTQINYMLGDNPDHRSYEVGYGENSPVNVHHRTAHGSWKNDLAVPETNRHILYGALVGGPTSTGEYEDARDNYINNEVACDYNAGFTALLCKMTSEYGGTVDTAFPEPEQRDDELYVETKLTPSSGGVTLSFKYTNHTAWPARCVDNISYRYYMDLSELLDAGYQASDVVMRVDRDQALMYSEYQPAEISSVTHYKDNIYYIEVTYPDGRVALPISEGQQQCELMLALVYPNYQSGWDAENDYSNIDLLEQTGEYVVTDKIPLYINGTLYSGTEPDGTTPTPTEPSTTSATLDETLPGDANVDGIVNLSDLVLLNRYLLRKGTLSQKGGKNADMDANNWLSVLDSIYLQRHLLI